MEALRIISDEHRNLWAVAATVEQVADEIDAGSPVDREFFTSVFDYIEHFADRLHHPKEDDFLFRLLRLRSSEANAFIERLQIEHRNEPEIVRQMREQLTSVTAGTLAIDAYTASLRTFAHSLKSHISTEEKDVIPLAREVLTAEDWQEIDAAFLDNEDPLFGDKAKIEFRELFHRVASLAPESVGLGGHSAGHLQTAGVSATNELLLSVKGLESSYGRIKAL